MARKPKDEAVVDTTVQTEDTPVDNREVQSPEVDPSVLKPQTFQLAGVTVVRN